MLTILSNIGPSLGHFKLASSTIEVQDWGPSNGCLHCFRVLNGHSNVLGMCVWPEWGGEFS